MVDVPSAFLRLSRHYLHTEYPAKLAGAVRHLLDEDIWWRPNEASNSIGNLLLHLNGNVRQWIVHGIGGRPDVRERNEEFVTSSDATKRTLLAALRGTLDEADQILAGLSPAELHGERTIQGFDTTVFGAVYHVVEHFSMHTGQILYIAKVRLGRSLEYYREGPDGDIEARWDQAST